MIYVAFTAQSTAISTLPARAELDRQVIYDLPILLGAPCPGRLPRPNLDRCYITNPDYDATEEMAEEARQNRDNLPNRPEDLFRDRNMERPPRDATQIDEPNACRESGRIDPPLPQSPPDLLSSSKRAFCARLVTSTFPGIIGGGVYAANTQNRGNHESEIGGGACRKSPYVASVRRF